MNLHEGSKINKVVNGISHKTPAGHVSLEQIKHFQLDVGESVLHTNQHSCKNCNRKRNWKQIKTMTHAVLETLISVRILDVLLKDPAPGFK